MATAMIGSIGAGVRRALVAILGVFARPEPTNAVTGDPAALWTGSIGVDFTARRSRLVKILHDEKRRRGRLKLLTNRKQRSQQKNWHKWRRKGR